MGGPPPPAVTVPAIDPNFGAASWFLSCGLSCAAAVAMQTTNTVSSFVNRVCYDKTNSYMLILLKNTWYHYCEIDAGTVALLISATSVGRYYNTNIRGTGKDGPFDCRTHGCRIIKG